MLGFLRRNLKTKNIGIKQGAYTSLVRPLLEYSCTIWDPHTADKIHKIEKVQNSAARYIACKPLNYKEPDSVSQIKADLKIEDLQNRRKKFKISMAHKIIKNEVEVQVPLQPGKNVPYYTFNERPSRTNTSRLNEVQALNEQHRNSFFVESIRLYNQIPEGISGAPDLKTFKVRLASHKFTLT